MLSLNLINLNNFRIDRINSILIYLFQIYFIKSHEIKQ